MLLEVKTPAIALQARLFRGLGDPSRLAILAALRLRPLTVSEIVQASGLSQPNVSNHLACLRECGLVAAEQHWRHVTYRLSDARVGELLALAEALLAGTAGGAAGCTRYTQEQEARNE